MVSTTLYRSRGIESLISFSHTVVIVARADLLIKRFLSTLGTISALTLTYAPQIPEIEMTVVLLAVRCIPRRYVVLYLWYRVLACEVKLHDNSSISTCRHSQTSHPQINCARVTHQLHDRLVTISLMNFPSNSKS